MAGVQYTRDGRGVKLPWVGDQYTMGRGFSTPWVTRSKYHGYGVQCTMDREFDIQPPLFW